MSGAVASSFLSISANVAQPSTGSWSSGGRVGEGVGMLSWLVKAGGQSVAVELGAGESPGVRGGKSASEAAIGQG